MVAILLGDLKIGIICVGNVEDGGARVILGKVAEDRRRKNSRGTALMRCHTMSTPKTGASHRVEEVVRIYTINFLTTLVFIDSGFRN